MPIESSQTIRARWVVPICRPPIEHGEIVVEHGRIIAVQPASPGSADHRLLDWENSIAIPGLVNTHTHLEFSRLDKPLGSAGMPFADWIRAVIDHRAVRGPAPSDAIADGWTQLTGSGTCAAGEIVTAAAAAANGGIYQQVGFRGVLFHERLGLSGAGIREVVQDLESSLRSHEASPTSRSGVSPHAPYSVHWQLFCELVALARRTGAPLAMHLAESRDELQLLQSRDGPFRVLLEDIGAWNPAAWPADVSILAYLKVLSRAPRVLVVHGNYLQAAEMDFMAAHRAVFGVAYCPRTHAYGGHAPYPLQSLRRRGIRVAIATDSRASNPDLCLARDVAAARDAFPDVPPEDWVRMVTADASWTLGLDAELGTLEKGKLAVIGRVKIPAGVSAKDPWEVLLEQLPHCRASFVA